MGCDWCLERSRSCARANLRARFRRATGLTPKRYAELVRFHRLIDATPVAGVAPWSELAADGGYSDQSHVIRDFKRFTGKTPTQLILSDFSKSARD